MKVRRLLDEVRKVAPPGLPQTLCTVLTDAHAERPDRIHARTSGIRVRYMHTTMTRLKRIEICATLRPARLNVLIGIQPVCVKA